MSPNLTEQSGLLLLYVRKNASIMQQQKHSWQAKRRLPRRPSLLVLLGAAALFALLTAADWGSARAAPQSGAPTFSIVSIDGNTLTLQFDGWTPGEIITLSYSANSDCSNPQSLPNNTLSATATSFSATYTWPGSGIQPGIYFLCATASEGTIASQRPIIVNSDGGVQSTPGAPGATPTGGSGSPAPTTSSSPGASPSAPPGATGTAGSGGPPGNQGTSASSSNGSGNTLIAIILLCLLVMALLAYLIRIWLQGRQPGGQSPGGGGQQGP